MGYKHLVFPEGSTFLVTGGAGFIGSNLCEAILDMGYNVRCLDDLSTGRKENVDMFMDRPGYTFIKGDINIDRKFRIYNRSVAMCDKNDNIILPSHMHIMDKELEDKIKKLENGNNEKTDN